MNMNLETVPWELAALCSAVGLVLLAAASMPRIREERARGWGLAAITGASCLLVFASGTYALIQAALLLQSAALIAAIPRTMRAPSATFDVLLILAGSLLVTSGVADIEATGWLLSLVPLLVTLGPNGTFTRRSVLPRSFVVTQSLGVLLLVLGSLTPTQASWSQGAAIAMILGGMLRQGLPPLHIPMRRFYAQAPLSLPLAYLGSPIGILAIAQGVRTLRGASLAGIGGFEAFGGLEGVVGGLATAALIYLGLLALAQMRGRSLLCQLTLYCWTLAASCVIAKDGLHHIAGTLYTLGAMGTTVGLGMTIWLLGERIGRDVVLTEGGLGGKMPLMAMMFLIFGLAMVGLPFTGSFIAEDLWLHGVDPSGFLISLLGLLSGALVAIAIFRAYTHTFLGSAVRAPDVRDLVARERVAFAFAFILVLGIGLWPRLVLPGS